MLGMRTWYAIVAAALSLALVVGWLRTPGGSGEVRARLSLAESMGVGVDAGFARAVEPRRFTFPADHGPHPEYATEWWYLTGNLETEQGREIGYQLTLFSSGIDPDRPPAGSSWSASRIFMGHLGLTDLAGRSFHSAERFSRAAAGLAGARGQPLRVWLDDWALTAGADPDSFELRAATPTVELDLRLVAARPIVLQGDAGLSRKGSEAGNASYYYSIPRLVTSGTATVSGEALAVRGLSWMDREWSTSALEAGQVGWDWFSLQLDDGSDLMVYRLRREDGSFDPVSSGTLVTPDGTPHRLTAVDFDLEVTGTWRSAATSVTYPSSWTLRIPAHELTLAVEPRLAEQEHDLSILYWEGSVAAAGERKGRSVAGKGYVELTGYPQSSD